MELTDLTVTEAAHHLETSERYVRELLEAGHLPCCTSDAGQVLISRASLARFKAAIEENAWIASHRYGEALDS